MLIDFASDVRAPTPTGAAEIVVPTKLSLIQEIDNLSHRLGASFANRLVNAKQRVEAVTIKNPKQLIMEHAQRLDDLTRTFGIIINGKLTTAKQQIEALSTFPNILKNRMASLNAAVSHLDQMLNSLSYKSVLQRGYAIVRNDKNMVISRVEDFTTPASIEFADGVAKVE